MGKFLLLAFRNVFRNRRRTVMTLLMVGARSVDWGTNVNVVMFDVAALAV